MRDADTYFYVVRPKKPWSGDIDADGERLSAVLTLLIGMPLVQTCNDKIGFIF